MYISVHELGHLINWGNGLSHIRHRFGTLMLMKLYCIIDSIVTNSVVFVIVFLLPLLMLLLCCWYRFVIHVITVIVIVMSITSSSTCNGGSGCYFFNNTICADTANLSTTHKCVVAALLGPVRQGSPLVGVTYMKLQLHWGCSTGTLLLTHSN